MSLHLLDPSAQLDELSFWFVVGCWGFIAGSFLGVAMCMAHSRSGKQRKQ